MNPPCVLRVLYLIFNEGYTGEIDLALEAIRLTRQLAASTDEREVAGLRALMLLHQARRAARRIPTGELVPSPNMTARGGTPAPSPRGVAILQSAPAHDRLGGYQVQAAIASLHADAPSAEETDWPQILEWYDELSRLSDSPVVTLNRAFAVGEVDGPLAGLRALGDVARVCLGTVPSRHTCTNVPGTSRRRRGGMPRQPGPPPTPPSGTTSPSKPRGSTRGTHGGRCHLNPVLATHGRPSRLAVDAWPKWHTEEDAEELGTKPTSLHHYVANGDEILEGRVDALFGVSGFAIRRRMTITLGGSLRLPPW